MLKMRWAVTVTLFLGFIADLLKTAPASAESVSFGVELPLLDLVRFEKGDSEQGLLSHGT